MYRYVRIITPRRWRQHFARNFVPAISRERLSFTMETHVQSQTSPCGNVCARSGTGTDCSPSSGSVTLSAICAHSSVPVALQSLQLTLFLNNTTLGPTDKSPCYCSPKTTVWIRIAITTRSYHHSCIYQDMHITEIRNHTKLLHSYVIRRFNVRRRKLQAHVYQYECDFILGVLDCIVTILFGVYLVLSSFKLVM